MKFKNEGESKAWALFAAGAPDIGDAENVKEAAEFACKYADRMLEQYRARANELAHVLPNGHIARQENGGAQDRP